MDTGSKTASSLSLQHSGLPESRGKYQRNRTTNSKKRESCILRSWHQAQMPLLSNERIELSNHELASCSHSERGGAPCCYCFGYCWLSWVRA